MTKKKKRGPLSLASIRLRGKILKESSRRVHGNIGKLHHDTEPKMPPLRALTSVPEKCDKCGNPRLRVFVETVSAFSIKMVHCYSGEGGCGKTWRLL